MSQGMLLVPVIGPLFFGGLLPHLPFKTEKGREICAEAAVLATSLFVFALLLFHPREEIVLIRLVRGMAIGFRLDALAGLFAGLVAFLWPLATLYAFEYMEKEEGRRRFFTFYLQTYGVTLGVAFAANLLTLYLFYELLTLITLPLVMHEMDARSVRAGRKYLIYSIAGATAAFMGIVILYCYGGGNLTFAPGGFVQEGTPENRGILSLGYVLMFFGFGVKAAVFPLHGWLPSAGVAPTPVTALLHAVAVVKAGVFAILRTIYFCFGAGFLAGTWVQDLSLGFALFTILFGSCMALKEQHLKRRLAYSTVSNLSYILFGAALMSEAGLTGALAHLLFHGVIKITLFFCAGIILHVTGREYVRDLAGLGKRMPVTFGAFTLASLALTGLPLLPGFVSKYLLATAGVAHGTVPGYLGAAVLLCSALLTAGYLFPVWIRAFFPVKGESGNAWEAGSGEEGIRDPGWRMCLPLFILCAALVLLGLFPGRILILVSRAAAGALG